ncbi:MAG: preprotein translocase subunit SecA [candidate division KSB1 bacterium]|nr:preprotein translocase subunit SecA [candidate division KSB1 bacterium]
MASLIAKIFGTKHERDIKKIMPIVRQINEIYESYHSLTDEQLRAKTLEFKDRIRQRVEPIQRRIAELEELLRADVVGGDGREEIVPERIREEIAQLEDEEFRITQKTLDEILPEAYAAVKETCRRLVGQRWKVTGHEIEWDMIPFDVQLIGAVVLHQGKIAEMATGEGKTLVATMPLYLNALPGKGVHLVTVNDYLAQRDAEWMGKIYEFLGLSVAYITNDMTPPQRKKAYLADITYGTNNEFGFDYLRDNMAIRLEDQVQRGHYYAIIDEVDSVLIDEARTPLIISGPVEHSFHRFSEMKPLVESLVRKQTHLVNSIVAEAERLLGEGKEYEAGIRLLQALRGAPKNKRLMKLLLEPGIKKLINHVENDFLRDKRMHEIDEELYFVIDERSHTIDLTEKGREELSPQDPELFVIPDLGTELARIADDQTLSPEEKIRKREEVEQLHAERSERVHNISQLLRAYSLFERDVDYIVTEDGRVVIVDEFTGRLMPGRRYSDGLHQALEAKEGVKIERETQTLATITLQNYFRKYKKLAGMTGTAATEAHEFWEIYKLDVVVIPTNKPVRRIDYDDVVYRTKREKYNAIIEEIEELYRQKRPVLVGTTSVEVSETLSRMLRRRGIPHNVLNAKYHQKEAEIVARAGQPGAVTIATNMAGRGTDIKLGPGVVKHPNCALVKPEPGMEPCPYIHEYRCYEDVPCGLRIIGTERHEARRIDLQLRGRAGRQGDPGSSRFYLSLEDDLMRLFGSDRIAAIMDRLGVQEGEVITHRMVSKSIERAQKRVEMQNFEIRKHLLEYDDVMNRQREVIYAMRNQALRGENLRQDMMDRIEQFADDLVSKYASQSKYPDDWNWEAIQRDFQRTIRRPLLINAEERLTLKPEDLFARIRDQAIQAYVEKEKAVGEPAMRQLERLATLYVIDERWRDHLYAMDQLKEGIGLRAYGQKDPLIEYKSESFNMFQELLEDINRSVLELIFKTQVTVEVPLPVRRRRPVPEQLQAVHAPTVGMGLTAAAPVGEASEIVTSQPGGPAQVKRQPIKLGQKIGRNDPCWCGSGKKYKHCHGRML